jgi:hypothetical protein
LPENHANGVLVSHGVERTVELPPPQRPKGSLHLTPRPSDRRDLIRNASEHHRHIVAVHERFGFGHSSGLYRQEPGVGECSLMSPEGVRGELYVLPASHCRSQRGDEACDACTWTTTSNAGWMPRGACSSPLAIHRTPTRPDSPGTIYVVQVQVARPRSPAEAAAADSRFRAKSATVPIASSGRAGHRARLRHGNLTGARRRE